MSDKMNSGGWIAFAEDSRRPHGQRCLYCGCQDKATEIRIYREGQYQICQRCHEAELAIDEFTSLYMCHIMTMNHSEYREYLKEEEAFLMARANWQQGYHCPFCGSLMKKFGESSIGQRPVALLSCCCSGGAELLYMPRSDGRCNPPASQQEMSEKRESVMNAVRKRVGKNKEITPMGIGELTDKLKCYGFLTPFELFKRQSIQDVLRQQIIDGLETYPEGDRDEVIRSITGGLPSIHFGLYPNPSGKLVILETLMRLKQAGATLVLPEPYPLKRLREFKWQMELFEPERYALYYFRKDDPTICYGITEEVEFLFIFPDIKNAERGASVFDAI